MAKTFHWPISKTGFNLWRNPKMAAKNEKGWSRLGWKRQGPHWPPLSFSSNLIGLGTDGGEGIWSPKPVFSLAFLSPSLGPLLAAISLQEWWKQGHNVEFSQEAGREGAEWPGWGFLQRQILKFLYGSSGLKGKLHGWVRMRNQNRPGHPLFTLT